jgi:hypothetical protein
MHLLLVAAENMTGSSSDETCRLQRWRHLLRATAVAAWPVAAEEKEDQHCTAPHHLS